MTKFRRVGENFKKIDLFIYKMLFSFWWACSLVTYPNVNTSYSESFWMNG